MKTAETWSDELRADPGMASDLEKLIEDIQSDARRSALMEAINIVNGLNGDLIGPRTAIAVAQAIQSAADNLQAERKER